MNYLYTFFEMMFYGMIVGFLGLIGFYMYSFKKAQKNENNK